MKHTIAVVLLILSAKVVYSCSCASLGWSVLDKFNFSESVVTGRIDSVKLTAQQESHWNMAVYITTLKNYKNGGNDHFLVYTAENSAACGSYFETDSTYIIFSNQDSSGKFITSSCSGNATLNSATQNGMIDTLDMITGIATYPGKPVRNRNTGTKDQGIYDIMGRRVVPGKLPTLCIMRYTSSTVLRLR